MVWLTDERRLALFPAGIIVRDSHHRESPTRLRQAVPEFKLSGMKLCSSDNHYTTAPHNTTLQYYITILQHPNTFKLNPAALVYKMDKIYFKDLAVFAARFLKRAYHFVDKNYRYYRVNNKWKKDGVKWMHLVCQSCIFLRGIFRSLSNICDRTFCENSSGLSVVHYFRKKLYRRCLIEFWISSFLADLKYESICLKIIFLSSLCTRLWKK